MTKFVSQLDSAGYFMGQVVADESPLEPGVFLIPRGAIDVPAPAIPAGKAARWVAGSWVFVDPPQDEPESQPPNPADQIRQAIRDIERESLMNRTVREDILKRYTQEAMTTYGVDEATAIAGMYAGNIAYRRIKDIDNQVAALRAQLAAIEGA